MTHASAAFTTTDAVCEALLTLIASIASDDQAEPVSIPALRVDGEVMKVRMMLNGDSVFVVAPVEVEQHNENALATASASAVRELRARRPRNSGDRHG